MFFNSKTLVALGLASLANMVIADSEKFYLLVIRSGSQYQNAGVSITDGKLYAGSSSNYLTAYITDDGEVKTTDGSALVVNDDDITTGSTGSTSWSISSGYLVYSGASGYSIDNGVISAGGSDGYALVAYDASSNSRAADFTPSGSSSTTSSEVSSASSSDAVSTISTQSNVTTTATFYTQTENAAAALRNVGAVGAFAAAAALLI